VYISDLCLVRVVAARAAGARKEGVRERERERARRAKNEGTQRASHDGSQEEKE
jgi:hypothetical protein